MLKNRIMACFIDFVLIGSLAILMHVPLRIIGFPGLIEALFSSMIFMFFGFLILAKDGPTWFIDFLHGQSPGKKAVGLIVTKLDGRSNISFQESIIRNIPLGLPYFFAFFCRVVHHIPLISWFLLFVGLLGFIACPIIICLEILMIYKDPEGRRWGDHKAGTRVVPFE